MSDAKPKQVRLQVLITIQADELLRAHSPRQGDKSRIVNGLILAKFMPEIREISGAPTDQAVP